VLFNTVTSSTRSVSVGEGCWLLYGCVHGGVVACSVMPPALVAVGVAANYDRTAPTPLPYTQRQICASDSSGCSCLQATSAAIATAQRYVRYPRHCVVTPSQCLPGCLAMYLTHCAVCVSAVVFVFFRRWCATQSADISSRGRCYVTPATLMRGCAGECSSQCKRATDIPVTALFVAAVSVVFRRWCMTRSAVC
jgi:hypothetical protein